VVVKAVCLLIGYCFGCFLTADVVTKRTIGTSVFDIGSHNPGMANVAAELGLKPAALTLLGDVLKTMVACWGCWLVFGHAASANRVLILYAGLGVTLGHNLPFWHGFSGGKGVATTCAAIFCFNPLWGLIACIVGLVVSVASGYLPFGAISIPLVFLISTAALNGPEPTVLVALLTLMMVWRHWRPMLNAIDGVEPKVNFREVVSRARASLNTRDDEKRARKTTRTKARNTKTQGTTKRPTTSRAKGSGRAKQRGAGSTKAASRPPASSRQSKTNSLATRQKSPSQKRRSAASTSKTRPTATGVSRTTSMQGHAAQDARRKPSRRPRQRPDGTDEHTARRKSS